LLIPALLFTFTAPAAADVYPMPGPDNPRIQSASWQAGERVVLTALPKTGLTVMLEPGETIRRVILSDDRSWDVTVSAEYDSFQITPADQAKTASLTVETDQRAYDFALQTGLDLTAAYLVRFAPNQVSEPAFEMPDKPAGETWSYRLKGDREVRPASIQDDGCQTFITYGEDQALPAVFAIGPTGKEEVVDGYMRDGRFVIDRVHQELIFRIDKEKATAKRSDTPEAAL
jgi:type IV secretion system protein VirB9